MFKAIIPIFFIQAAFLLIKAEPTLEDIPSLPYCPDKNGSGLVLVSTLDGNLSAVNSTGSLIWQIQTGPGPLLTSNIHKLELTNNGEWIRIIPSLTGTLYKFDGSTIDPIPITAESLLKSSFRYSDDLVIAGGIEVRTYGVGFRSGKLIYECTSVKCSNTDSQNVDDMLLIERTTHTIRAVEPNTGSERWNFSVGLHNIKLPRISCIDGHTKLFDWNLTAVLPEGKLKASTILNNVEHSWQYTFTSPIVRIWRWSGKNLTEVNLFAPNNIPNLIISSSYLPSIYIGMHNRQLYIHESTIMQDILHGQANNDLAVTESTSITKIPWKPISASSKVTEDDSTALSVLNLSEYANDNGYYLYTEADLRKKDKLLCDTNSSILGAINENEAMDDIVGYYSMFLWWKEFFLMMSTIIICHFLFRFWMQHYHKQEVIIIEKPVEAHITTERQLSEKEPFSSPYLNDFETIRCIGKGGFGLVFEVKKKIDECSYAIKRITLPNDQKARNRVMREVKALAKLDHKNIVRYFNSWVEHPPLGWQQEHDKKWLNSLCDSSSMFSEENTTTVATPNHTYKAKRSKSASVSIDIPIKSFEENPVNFDEDHDNDSDDSYIVFENNTQNHENFNSAHVTFKEDYCKSVSNEATISSGIETTHNLSPVIGHMKKKIDWKRPGRRHHSWDLTTENNAITKKYNKIPPVYLYIQMQLCQKESLKEWLNTNQERDYNTVLNIFLQILDAVEYVHLSGLIHRDLKPSNIFFALDGQIKVGDFGLVKDMDDAFDLEMIKKGHSPAYRGHTDKVGTQLYMSPEQFHSRIYDYKVDIYSLGLIFFELLVPFSTDMERIKKLSEVKENKYPKYFSKEYPNEYILLQCMLCKDPNKRLTTIGIKSRPPFNKTDPNYNEDSHYRLTNFQKN
ncbi:eukaryotic translation initiation factor 2-alpha kinase [Anoplophora glabripennis]|uniref:eukaryotic translation initiation factor 2-alpha kinase n=1 Tax=Anoplophora glabripennis TaxID=217634 RepID=UPI0008745CDF|nr:eukaryotic translation initiation factor 2-alpha kinase [Anoplophora glabripennis]